MKKNQYEELDSLKQISKPNRIKKIAKNKRPINKAKILALTEEIDDEFIVDDELEIFDDTEDFK